MTTIFLDIPLTINSTFLGFLLHPKLTRRNGSMLLSLKMSDNTRPYITRVYSRGTALEQSFVKNTLGLMNRVEMIQSVLPQSVTMMNRVFLKT